MQYRKAYNRGKPLSRISIYPVSKPSVERKPAVSSDSTPKRSKCRWFIAITLAVGTICSLLYFGFSPGNLPLRFTAKEDSIFNSTDSTSSYSSSDHSYDTGEATDTNSHEGDSLGNFKQWDAGLSKPGSLNAVDTGIANLNGDSILGDKQLGKLPAFQTVPKTNAIDNFNAKPTGLFNLYKSTSETGGKPGTQSLDTFGRTKTSTNSKDAFGFDDSLDATTAEKASGTQKSDSFVVPTKTKGFAADGTDDFNPLFPKQDSNPAGKLEANKMTGTKGLPGKTNSFLLDDPMADDDDDSVLGSDQTHRGGAKTVDPRLGKTKTAPDTRTDTLSLIGDKSYTNEFDTHSTFQGLDSLHKVPDVAQQLPVVKQMPVGKVPPANVAMDEETATGGYNHQEGEEEEQQEEEEQHPAVTTKKKAPITKKTKTTTKTAKKKKQAVKMKKAVVEEEEEEAEEAEGEEEEEEELPKKKPKKKTTKTAKKTRKRRADASYEEEDDEPATQYRNRKARPRNKRFADTEEYEDDEGYGPVRNGHRFKYGRRGRDRARTAGREWYYDDDALYDRRGGADFENNRYNRFNRGNQFNNLGNNIGNTIAASLDAVQQQQQHQPQFPQQVANGMNQGMNIPWQAVNHGMQFQPNFVQQQQQQPMQVLPQGQQQLLGQPGGSELLHSGLAQAQPGQATAAQIQQQQPQQPLPVQAQPQAKQQTQEQPQALPQQPVPVQARPEPKPQTQEQADKGSTQQNKPSSSSSNASQKDDWLTTDTSSSTTSNTETTDTSTDTSILEDDSTVPESKTTTQKRNAPPKAAESRVRSACSSLGFPDTMDTVAVVGNGPITEQQRKDIQGHDIVIRFNHLDNMMCGDKISMWMVRYDSKAKKFKGPGETRYCETDKVVSGGTNMWLLGGTSSAIKALDASNPGLSSVHHSPMSLASWKAVYQKEVVKGDLDDEPATGWIAIMSAIACVPDSVSMHVYGFNWHQDTGKHAAAEKKFLNNLASSGGLIIHDTPCTEATTCGGCHIVKDNMSGTYFCSEPEHSLIGDAHPSR